ncbi:MAG: winged helix-turn-helix domain-containing protein [Thermoprotei archaeon]
MSLEDLARKARLFSNPVRLRILGLLTSGPKHVYAIAKEINQSYPLTYLYMTSLEKAGLVKSVMVEHEQDERKRKVYRLEDFRLEISAEAIASLMEKEKGGEA